MKIFRRAVCISLVVAVLMITVSTGIGATMEYTGTVEQKGHAVVLFTPDDTYILKGSDMLPDMIGKKVTVTGTLEENDLIKVLTVVKFEEVKEK